MIWSYIQDECLEIKTKYQMERLWKIQTDCTHDIINNNRYITCQKFRTILILDKKASKSETVRYFFTCKK